MIATATQVVDVSPALAFAIAHRGVWPRPAVGMQRELHLGGHVPLRFEFDRVEPPHLVTERMVAGPAFLQSVEARWTKDGGRTWNLVGAQG